MGFRRKLTGAIAGAAQVTGQAAAATGRGVVAVASHPTTTWVVKTGGKAALIGAGTAAGMAIGGPVGAAVAATFAGAAMAGRGGAPTA